MTAQQYYNSLPGWAKGITFIILLLIIYVIYINIRRAATRPVIPTHNPNRIPIVGPGQPGKPLQWNPDPLAMELKNTIGKSNFGTYPDIAQKVIDLQTDDQLILLYEQYNAHYASPGKTLTTECFPGPNWYYNLSANREYKQVRDMLLRLNLI